MRTVWKDELVLVSQEAADEQTNGQGFPNVGQEKQRPVYANKKSVGYNEFYRAAEAGYTVELKFEIRSEEYEGETMAEYDGRRYRILRAYETTDIIELTLSDLSTRGGLPGGNV